MTKSWLIVGISGVTCGGKGTLVEAIKKAYPESVVVHQDDYFLQQDDPRHTKVPSLNCFNWEILTSLDMDKIKQDVQEILGRSSENQNLLIIEGFLVLNDEFLSKICDKKLYFTLPLDECRRRRFARTYIPADVPGYFDNIVWPEYLKSKEEAMKLNPDMKFVDGLKKTDIILKEFIKSFS